MSGIGSRSRVVTRTAPRRPARRPRARPPAPVRRARRGRPHRADPADAAAAGFRRLLDDPEHCVVLAVLPVPTPPPGVADERSPVGLAVLGTDPLSRCSAIPQVTVDTFVVHREHRRSWGGRGPARRSRRLRAGDRRGARRRSRRRARGRAAAVLRPHGVRAAHDPADRRLDSLTRSLAAWQRSGYPSRRRGGPARGRWSAPLPTAPPPRAEVGGSGRQDHAGQPGARGRPSWSSLTSIRNVARVRPLRDRRAHGGDDAGRRRPQVADVELDPDRLAVGPAPSAAAHAPIVSISEQVAPPCSRPNGCSLPSTGIVATRRSGS